MNGFLGDGDNETIFFCDFYKGVEDREGVANLRNKHGLVNR